MATMAHKTNQIWRCRLNSIVLAIVCFGCTPTAKQQEGLICVEALRNNQFFSQHSLVEADRIIMIAREEFPQESKLFDKGCEDFFLQEWRRARDSIDCSSTVSCLVRLRQIQELPSFQKVVSENSIAVSFYKVDMSEFAKFQVIEQLIADTLRRDEELPLKELLPRLTSIIERLGVVSPCRLPCQQLIDDLNLYEKLAIKPES